MTVQTSKLEWRNIGRSLAIAQIVISTTDTYNISLVGNQQLEFGNIHPVAVIVDNYNNDQPATINIAGINYGVGRFKRQTFRIDPAISQITFTLGGGSATLTFLNKFGLENDGEDSFAVQQAAAQFVVYQFVPILTTTAQSLVAHQNKNLLLSAGTTQDFDLLGIIAAGVPNGYYNPSIRNVGSARWRIQPAVGETINNLWTNTTPLQLSAGDNIALWCDGAQWQARGCVRHLSGQLTMSGLAGLVQSAHGLGVRPTYVEIWLECTTANLNYAVGDFVQLSPYAAVDAPGAAMGGFAAYHDATNLNVRIGNGALAISNKTTGAYGAITFASWRMHLNGYWEF